MQTLSIHKNPETQQKTQAGQLRLSLPRLRVPVQPAASARIPGVPHSRPGREAGPGLGVFHAPSRWKSLDHGHNPGLHEPGTLVLRSSQGRSDARPDPTLSPVAFAREVLNVQLWHKQEEVLNALTSHRRVAVKAGNGLGKGFCAAVAVLWFMHTRQDAIVLTTAPTFRQVRHILWRQLRRLYRPAAATLGGTMLDTRWEFSESRYALGLSADGTDQFQGFHSPNVFIVVDEAEGVEEGIYEAIESVMTSADPLLLLIGNPTSMSGAFHRAFHQERSLYRTITISALESPNVRAGQVVIPGLTSAQWVEERRQVWGKKHPSYLSRVLGEFPKQSEDTLISLTDIEAAANLVIVDAESWSIGAETVLGSDRSPNDDVILAVDVARYGSDRSVILRRRGDCVEDIQVLRQMNTMQVTGWVVAAIREHNPAHVLVDEIGIGAGVVDRLRELGHPVRGVNVAQKARDDKTFANLRAEGYWNLRDHFVSGRISIPNDSELIAELATLRYNYNSHGHLKIESKEEIRKRGLPSPDKADALMLSYQAPKGAVKIWT